MTDCSWPTVRLPDIVGRRAERGLPRKFLFDLTLA
jgi:hypothetical protein